MNNPVHGLEKETRGAIALHVLSELSFGWRHSDRDNGNGLMVYFNGKMGFLAKEMRGESTGVLDFIL